MGGATRRNLVHDGPTGTLRPGPQATPEIAAIWGRCGAGAHPWWRCLGMLSSGACTNPAAPLNAAKV
jgi:hypothetical protein